MLQDYTFATCFLSMICCKTMLSCFWVTILYPEVLVKVMKLPVQSRILITFIIETCKYDRNKANITRGSEFQLCQNGKMKQNY